MGYVNEFVAYFQAAWPAIVEGRNLIQFVILAVLLGFATGSPGRLIIVPLVAAILYVAVDIAYYAATEGKEIILPVVDKTFGFQIATLYVLFILPIAAVFGLKKLIETIRG
jgi:hypothetical protein